MRFREDQDVENEVVSVFGRVAPKLVEYRDPVGRSVRRYVVLDEDDVREHTCLAISSAVGRRQRFEIHQFKCDRKRSI